MTARAKSRFSQQLTKLLGLTVQPETQSILTANGETMIANAASGRGEPRCAWDCSNLTLTAPGRKATPSIALLIDIGGTHTKVALSYAHGSFELLFDHLNESLRPTGLDPTNPALSSFLNELFRRISQTAPHIIGTHNPLRVGVIWSNQLTTAPLDTPHVRGITGLVHGLHRGGYRKGEWFLDGLCDGDDLGVLFLAALTQAGIHADHIILGNDTIFTLFAHPGAHAGVVVSSGANCTVVAPGRPGDRAIFNSELGGTLIIPDRMLSKGDRIFAAARGSATLALEELCAGAWFQELVVGHIVALAEYPEGAALAELAEALKAGSPPFTNASLSALLRGEASLLEEFRGVSDSAQETLCALLSALIERAGAYAAVLCYLSVSTQIATQLEQEPRALELSLDSSMARHFPGFYGSLSRHLRALIPHQVSYQLHVVEPLKLTPDTEITVPMMGLAQALRDYHELS